ncbi:uncharacterized protein TRIADDRAFT_28748, partial [Trichoplax adhaerens]
VSTYERLMELRDYISDRPETCDRTCYSLQNVDGVRLDELAVIGKLQDIDDGSLIRLMDEEYNLRDVKIHLRRLRDLLTSFSRVNAYTAQDNMSLTFLSGITEIDIEALKKGSTKESQLDCAPPCYLIPGSATSNGVPLTPLYFNESYQDCLKELSTSGWNPPPPNRKLQGDLMYVNVETLEGETYNITASITGFFVNRTKDHIFNPAPSSEFPLSHTLAGLLNRISPLFKKNFLILQKVSLKTNPLELVPTPYQVFPWAVPKLDHGYDKQRAEDYSFARVGYEEHLAGQLRDWNDDFQSAKEMPTETIQEKIERDRTIFRVNTDFVAVATKGAIAVVDGNVVAMNPAEPERLRLYIWNNIFFSFAVDCRDQYKQLGGDIAAYRAAGQDVHAIDFVQKLDVDGLHTLETAVIDYCGRRIIAQSLIPGILNRSQENSVIYGSIDSGLTIAADEVFIEQLKKYSQLFRVRPISVVDKFDQDVKIWSSIELKGILGYDRRRYIVDLIKTLPIDVNFIEANESNHDDKPRKYFPLNHGHCLSRLRRELVEAFIAGRYMLYWRLVAIYSYADQQKQFKDKDGVDQHGNEALSELPVESLPSTEEIKEGGKNELSDSNGPNEGQNQSTKKAAAAVGSYSSTELDIRFNPDLFTPNIKFSESESEALGKDKSLAHDAAKFLVESIIPKTVQAVIFNLTSPVDGNSFKDVLHQRGINIRYIGYIASLIANTPELSYVYKLCLTEMITRIAKRTFKELIRRTSFRVLSCAISHFLNCFLLRPSKKKKNRKKHTKPHNLAQDKSDLRWISLSPEDLWKQISSEISTYFGYEIPQIQSDNIPGQYLAKLQRISVLRAFCMQTGVQVVLREYIFDNKKVLTFNDDDIVNIIPRVKHLNPKHCKFYLYLYFFMIYSYITGLIQEALDVLIEALAIFQQVYGPLHPDVFAFLEKFTRLFYSQAVCFQKKATIVSERLFGVDSQETIIAYVHLSLYCHAAGQKRVALRLMYRARYLTCLVFGEDHPDMATIDSNIGLILFATENSQNAIQFLINALEIQQRYYGDDSINAAISHHLLAIVKSTACDFRSAMHHEKQVFNIYNGKFGEKDDRTKESSEFLNRLTGQAVVMQKKVALYCDLHCTTLPMLYCNIFS